MGWEQELTDAVYTNNVELVENFLGDQEVLRGLGRKEWLWGEAPLHKASALGRTKILRVLVESGGDVNSYSIHDNDDRMTCLHLAVWCNQVETTRLIMQMGADTTLIGTWLDFSGTPADFAHHYKHAEVLQVLQGTEMRGTMGKLAGAHISRVHTSAILSGLENLPSKEKALRKAQELQHRASRAEKAVADLKKKLASAERELFEVKGNPYYLPTEAIDELGAEIDELKVFSTEVRKILADRAARRQEHGHQ